VDHEAIWKNIGQYACCDVGRIFTASIGSGAAGGWTYF
jgi:hypothetical protein